MTTKFDSPALVEQADGYPAKWKGKVPSRVCMKTNVSSDIPIKSTRRRYRADSGLEYDAWVNKYGALCAILEDGAMLGLKPDEFTVIAWHETNPNSPAFIRLESAYGTKTNTDYAKSILRTIESLDEMKKSVTDTGKAVADFGKAVKDIEKIKPFNKADLEKLMDFRDYTTMAEKWDRLGVRGKKKWINEAIRLELIPPESQTTPKSFLNSVKEFLKSYPELAYLLPGRARKAIQPQPTRRPTSLIDLD